MLGTKEPADPRPSDARRSGGDAVPILRTLLADKNAETSTVITALRTLDQIGTLTPADGQPFISHAEVAVRIHALQLADRWFAEDEGRALLNATVTAAASEQNPRVQIQFALSLGESLDPRAFALLARFAREKLAVRWMDAAVMSSLHGRGVEMLAELLREPGGSAKFLAPLAQSIAARRDEPELARALHLVATAPPGTQATVLNALAKGRRNAPRKPLADKSGRASLASLAASSNAEVRQATRALEDTFIATATDDEALVAAGQLPTLAESMQLKKCHRLGIDGWVMKTTQSSGTRPDHQTVAGTLEFTSNGKSIAIDWFFAVFGGMNASALLEAGTEKLKAQSSRKARKPKLKPTRATRRGRTGAGQVCAFELVPSLEL